MLKHIALIKSGTNQMGGLEKHTARIADAFTKDGIRVSLLTSKNRDIEEWIANENPDAVLGMDRTCHATHLRAGNGVHISFLESRLLSEGRLKYWTCLCNPKHRKILRLEKASFESPKLKKIIANSHMVKRQILEHYRVRPDQIEVIHNGVEWREMEEAFTTWQEGKISACKELSLDPETFHFLFIGNGYTRKGLGPLLEGLARMKKRNFHLSVIGKDKNTDFFQARALILGLKNQVRFFGPRPDIRKFYQLADVLVIPSFYDPFANVTVEALAMGLFVVTSKYNGGAEVLTSQSGLIIPDLLNLTSTLEESIDHKKTVESSIALRLSISHLDFSSTLHKLIQACD